MRLTKEEDDLHQPCKSKVFHGLHIVMSVCSVLAAGSSVSLITSAKIEIWLMIGEMGCNQEVEQP